MITRKVNSEDSNNNNNNGKAEKKVGRKRVKKKEPVISSTGVEVKECYCRKCMTVKPVDSFLQTCDPYLDANGYLSVCKQCIQEMYNRIFQNEHLMEKTILRLCRTLNVKYDEDAISATQKHVGTFVDKGKELKDINIFGIYKSKLAAVQRTEISQRGKGDTIDLTFVEPGRSVVIEPLEDTEENFDLKEFWGDIGFSYDDYMYLQKEYKNLCKYHRVDNYAEIVLAKEVCFKLLDIKRARIEEKPTDKLVKDLQELMKNLAISPKESNVANQGKNQDTFGQWVKEIEQFEPAEWWDTKREKYVDINGWGKFAKNHIIRTIQNTLGLTKNFTLVDDAKEDEFEEDFNTEEGEVNAESE